VARSNPRLPAYLRARAAKVPDWKLKEAVGKLPRLSGAERRELSSHQLKSSYVPEHLKKHIETLRHGGASVSHADEDVRFFLSNVGAERDLGRESLERYYRGFVKVANEAGVRLKPGLNPKPLTEREDVKRSAKVITQRGLAEKQKEMVEEQRGIMLKQQIREGLRGPNRKEFLRGGAPGMGSSVVSKEQPSGAPSAFGYKPGSAPGEPGNPANQPPANPATGPANPANAPSTFGAPPIAGFHGLGHAPGREIPGEPGGLSHAPVDYPAPAPAAPTDDHGPLASAAPTPAAPSNPPDEAPPAAPEAPPPGPPEEPPDMEIG
jgi:hypothetical protein